MNIYNLFPLISSVFALSVGIFIFKKGEPKLKGAFFLWCLTIFIWLFSYFICYSTRSEKLAALFARFACTSVMFLANTFYQFIVNFLELPKEKKWVRVSYIISFIMLPFFLFTNVFLAGTYKYFWGYYSKAGILHPVFLLFFFTIFIRGFFLLLKSYAKITTPFRHNQIKYVFISFIVALLGAIDFIPKYGVEIYPFGFLFMILFITITAYAILRYRLMDIYVYIKRTAAYSISTGLLTGFFIVLVLFSTKYLSPRIGISEWKLTIIPALIIAMLFAPLKGRVQKIVDKVFYKRTSYFLKIKSLRNRYRIIY